MVDKIVNDIYSKIQEYNSTSELDAIPHSDIFNKKMESMFGLSDEDFIELIELLKESHKIFVIEITKEDKNKNINKIEGYVDADLETIRRLKSLYYDYLVEAYNKQFKKRMGASQIIKEIFPKIRQFNNTPLGHIINKAIMLNEYEKLLEKEYGEYSHNWKNEKLDKLTAEHLKLKNKHEVKDETNEISRRAIDTPEYKSFEHNKQTLKKMLSIYGVDFFYRVNLRKYNFTIIREAIEQGEINMKKDLRLLKDMLKKIKMNVSRDPELTNYYEEIHKIERAISKGLVTAK